MADVLEHRGSLKYSAHFSDEEEYGDVGQPNEFEMQQQLHDRRTQAEAEVMAEIIERRRSGIAQVSDLFQNVRELGKEFNQELDVQGGKLETVGADLEVANHET